MIPASAIAEAHRREYRAQGFLRDSFALSAPAVLPQLCRDVAEFDALLSEWRSLGHARIPYLFTAAIERVAHDSAITAVIEALLGTQSWVVWGPNILRETPDAAARWHVDLESRYWPTVTVAVGLSGCSPATAIWCLPGTHLLSRTPAWSGDACATDRVLRCARRARADLGPPEQFAAFGDGRFCVFNARTWHRGTSAPSAERLVLFLHYQVAGQRRVPLMLDYVRHRWSREAAPHRANAGTVPVTEVAPVPLRERALAAAAWLRPGR